MLKALMAIIIIATIVVGFWFGIGWFERSNLFYPSAEFVGNPAESNLEYEDVNLTTPDGQTINGWYVPSSSATPKSLTLILYHGNGGNISHRLDKIGMLHKLGLNVLIIDYRGFGKSTGRPNEKGMYIDAETALSYLLEEKKIPLNQIIFYGESLGGAIAIEMAFRYHARGLILEDTFTSVVHMSKVLFPWLPAQYLVQNRFDSISKIPHIKCPIVIFHSHDDETVPYFMGEQLYKAAPKGTVFVELYGPHNDAYAIGAKQYNEAIQNLLDQ